MGKRSGPPSGGAPKNKRKYFAKGPDKDGIPVGSRGILVSCPGGKENQAGREACDLFQGILDDLLDRGEGAGAGAGAGEGAGSASSLAASIAAEVAELTDRKAAPFFFRPTGIHSTVYVEYRPPADVAAPPAPSALVLEACRRAARGEGRRPKLCTRWYPLDVTCRATIADIREASRGLIDEAFPSGALSKEAMAAEAARKNKEEGKKEEEEEGKEEEEEEEQKKEEKKEEEQKKEEKKEECAGEESKKEECAGEESKKEECAGEESKSGSCAPSTGPGPAAEAPAASPLGAATSPLDAAASPLGAASSPARCADPSRGVRFAAKYEHRAAPRRLERMGAIDAAIAPVPVPPNAVDLSNPDLTILINVLKGTVGLCVVPDFRKLLNFNMRSLHDAASAANENEDNDDD